MPMERSLGRETFDWRRLRLPTERFRTGQRAAATYEAETAIDHVKSSVDALLDGWLQGRDWDFPDLIAHRIEDVEQARRLLHPHGTGAEPAASCAAYLDATTALLNRLAAHRYRHLAAE
jgi:hypothetical protein